MGESNAAAIVAVSTAELSKASNLFGTLKKMRMQLKNIDEESLDRAFEIHVQGVLQKLDDRLTNLPDEQLRGVEIIMAKHGVYDAAFQQVVLLCQSIAPGLGDCLRELRSVHSGFLTELQHSFCELANKNIETSNELEETQEIATKMQQDVISLQDTLKALNEESADYQGRVLELRNNLREAAQQINYLREVVTENHKALSDPASKPSMVLARTVNSPAKSNAPLDSSLLSYNTTYLNNTLNIDPNTSGQGMHLPQVFGLPQEITNVVDTTPGRRRSNSGGETGGTSTPTRHKRHASAGVGSALLNSSTGSDGGRKMINNNQQDEWNNSVKDARIKDDWLRELEENNNDNNNNNGSTAGGGSRSSTPSRGRGSTSTAASTLHKGGLSIVNPVNWLLTFRSEVQKAMDEGRCRDLTTKECADFVTKFYQSKVIANDKAVRGIGNVPMETMEQHVFRTFEHRYGLRSLAVEHAGAFVKSLKAYASDDSEVQVFYKIFRNELEEDYRLIQADLYSSIKDLTLVQIMSRYPNKDQTAAALLVEQKLAEGYINEEEWTDMANYLYNEVDSSTLCTILRKLGVQERGKVTYFESPTGVVKDPLPAGDFNVISRGNTAYKIENRSSAAAHTKGYDQKNAKDVKRLGYSSPTLKITVKDPAASKAKKDMLKVPFRMFLKTTLDFQLRSHQQYLNNFVRVFRDIDQDFDGVINAAEFKECYLLIRRYELTNHPAKDFHSSSSVHKSDHTYVFNDSPHLSVLEEGSEEMQVFVDLICQLDPQQTDRVTFSAAVTGLSKLKS